MSPAQSLLGQLAETLSSGGRAIVDTVSGLTGDDASLVKGLLGLHVHDENSLTEAVFQRRHPELGGRALDPDKSEDKPLVKEWLAIRDSVVRPAAREDVASFIDSHRAEYGFSAENERKAARFYSKGKRTTLRAIDPGDIAKHRSLYASSGEHSQRSLELLQGSSLRNFESGSDLPFIAAIATREAGSSVFRTDTKRVVSGGKDTHAKGVSGLDNLWRREYRQEFEAAGLFIQKVADDDEDLRAQGRNPAWIEARDLLFGHMITTANHEKLFRTHHIPKSAKSAGVEEDPDDLWRALTTPSRRTWLGLFYSGVGHVGKTLTELHVAQERASQSVDLNAVMTHDDFDRISRVVLARATALRAAIFDG